MAIDLLGKENADNAYGINTIEKGNVYLHPYPVKISVLKEIIAKAEEKGSNYMTVDYNCDHNEYEFAGIEIRVPDDMEIEEANNKEKTKNQKAAENLRNRAQKLIEEAEKLSKL